MSINRKICVVFSNFVKKKLLQKSKKIANVQVSSFRLNEKQSNSYNQSTENKMAMQNVLVKSKICLFGYRLGF